MAEYWGSAAIAKRLNISVSSLWRFYQERGLLMYQRHRSGYGGKGLQGPARALWYTNDGLLLAWEIAYAKQWREQVWSAGRKQRKAAQEPYVELAPTMESSASPPDIVHSIPESS